MFLDPSEASQGHPMIIIWKKRKMKESNGKDKEKTAAAAAVWIRCAV